MYHHQSVCREQSCLLLGLVRGGGWDQACGLRLCVSLELVPVGPHRSPPPQPQVPDPIPAHTEWSEASEGLSRRLLPESHTNATLRGSVPSLHIRKCFLLCVVCVSLCGAWIYSHICALCTNIDVACLPVSLATCVWFSVSHWTWNSLMQEPGQQTACPPPALGLDMHMAYLASFVFKIYLPLFMCMCCLWNVNKKNFSVYVSTCLKLFFSLFL